MNPLIVEMEKNAQIHKLDDEVEQLRKALNKILGLWRKGLTVQIGEIAQRALER